MQADPVALSKTAQRLRRISLISTTQAGSGHPTTCLSSAEIVAVLFFHEMRFDPKDPRARNVDSFVLSKGHAAPILWAALREAGAISEDPTTLRAFTSPLEGHPTPLCPWVKIATGSLGQGLSASCGIAWARRHDMLGARVYCLMGDGETAEGSVWEAAQFAAHNALDNLCAVVDINALGQSGATMLRHDVEAYARRFDAFGWNSVIVDGHSIAELIGAFEKARAAKGRPTVVLARTLKGKGVGFLEGKEGWHGKPLKKGQELDAALKEIGDPNAAIDVRPRRYPTAPAPVADRREPAAPTYQAGQEIATREAYGNALVKLGAVNPHVIVIDGDTKNSTFSEKFKAAFPDRFIEAYIAEQNMVGIATGLAGEGKIPFASTFACFLTRAVDQIRMAAYSRPPVLVLCGSHAGVSIGEDGPSQMGLEDIAIMRAVFGSTVLYPSDAVSAERLTAAACAAQGVVYIRTTRPKTKLLYPNTEPFPIGGSKVLRRSDRDRLTLVAAGITLHEALEAHVRLAQQGIAVRVVDLYSIKPIDSATLREAARETRAILTVEDHSVHGGLGDAVRREVDVPVAMLGVREIPRSGAPRELLETHRISATAIVEEARRVLS
ncbi:MAG: transketolase [Planctomycetes bacterium]|nr:transketolase [Planctomycetota bacterium]